MKQVFVNRAKSVPSNTATGYTGILCPMETPGAESLCKHIWVVPGVFSNFVVDLNVSPGVGKSWTFTVRKNGVDTALTVTISDTNTTARDTTNSVTVASGDLLSLKWVPSGTPTSPGSTGVTIALDFDGTTANQSGHTYSPQIVSTTAGRRNGVFAGSGSWTLNAGVSVATVAAVAGTIDALGLNLASGAPGVPDSIAVVIYKNGVKQDGTGGTVNTTTTLGSTATSVVQTFSLPVAPGDVLYLETTVMASLGNQMGVGIRFTATTAGQSNFAGQTSNLNIGINPAFASVEGGFYIWGGTEATVSVPSGVSPFILSGLQVALQTQPGTSKTWTISLRRNTASPGPSVAITGTSTAGADTSSTASIVDRDLLALRAVPTSSPAVGNMSWAMIQSTAMTVLAVEAITANDNQTARLNTRADQLVVETVTVTENVGQSILGALSRAVVENVTVADTGLRKLAALLVQVTETLAATDVLTRYSGVQLRATPTEVIGVDESLTRFVNPLLVRVFDTAGVQEAFIPSADDRKVFDRVFVRELVQLRVPLLSVRASEQVSVRESSLNANGSGGLGPAPSPGVVSNTGDYWTVGI